MSAYSMYGAVPLRTIKKALLDLKAAGRLDKREDGHADQLHLRRPRLQHAPRDGRVPGDQAGPHLPVGRGVVRFRALVAALSPAHRDGRARGARRRRSPTPRTWSAYLAQEKQLGADLDPKDRARARHAPHPRSAQGQAARLPDQLDAQVDVVRCARARWCWWRDEDYHRHEQAFQEAVFTHASTSPNQQIIASLDVARRQMELEGYELVMQADPARDRDPRAR